MTLSHVLILGIAITARFRCKKIATKPDAHSWSVERDFIAGVEVATRMHYGSMHPIIAHCELTKRSITTLTAEDINAFEADAEARRQREGAL